MKTIPLSPLTPTKLPTLEGKNALFSNVLQKKSWLCLSFELTQPRINEEKRPSYLYKPGAQTTYNKADGGDFLRRQ